MLMFCWMEDRMGVPEELICTVNNNCVRSMGSVGCDADGSRRGRDEGG